MAASSLELAHTPIPPGTLLADPTRRQNSRTSIDNLRDSATFAESYDIQPGGGATFGVAPAAASGGGLIGLDE
jgi:hypothetical protein